MEKKIILFLLAVFAFGSADASRLDYTLSKKGHFISKPAEPSVDMLPEAVRQHVSESTTSEALAEAESQGISREEFLKRAAEDEDQEFDDDDEDMTDAQPGKKKKKKKGFFDRISSVHKVAMGGAGLAALIGIAALAWQFKDQFNEEGIKKLTNGFFDSATDKTLKSLNLGLSAKDDAIASIQGGSDEFAKLGLTLGQKLQKTEDIATKAQEMMDKVNPILGQVNDQQLIQKVAQMLPVVQGMIEQVTPILGQVNDKEMIGNVGQILPHVEKIMGGLTRTTELTGRFLTGAGIEGEKVKTSGEYDPAKVSGVLGALLGNVRLPFVGAPIQEAANAVNEGTKVAAAAGGESEKKFLSFFG